MDFFSVLASGAKFDRKRFRDDVEIFKPAVAAVEAVAGDEPTATTAMLDYFNPAPKVIAKKAKHIHQEDEEDKAIPTGELLSEHLPSLATKDDVKLFQKEHQIRVFGTDIPKPIRSFQDLFGQPFLQSSIKELGYTKPSPVQMQSIPIVLSGRDVLACAPTGSGKTLAFSIPILHDLKAPLKGGFRAVIVSPTRELAQQIYREMKRLCSAKPFKICVLTTVINTDNSNAVNQFKNFDILITTPLRLVTALKKESIKLDLVRHIVFDEADRLLDDGFLEQADEILAACTSSTLQTSLFSATIPSGIETLAKTFMKDPIRLVIGASNAATEIINQKLLFVGQEEGKLVAIRQLLSKGLKPPVLIFVQSIERARQLFHEMVYDNVNVDVIHSERTKAQRDTIVQNFRMGKIWVLISTELIARGIDFKGVRLVINYDFPQSVQSYIHRIGRTGRADRPGEAITYFTKADAPYLKSIVNVMKQSGCEVADWMLKLPKPSKMLKKSLRVKPLHRKDIAIKREK